MSKTDVINQQQVFSDAAKWRELITLLQQKAYGKMTPEEIARHFPDLREIYRTFQDMHTNGHRSH